MEPATDLTLDAAAHLAAEEHEVSIVGRSPWNLAWRRLRRNYIALASLGVFVLIVLACALAPVYARHVAHTGLMGAARVVLGLMALAVAYYAYQAR